MPEGSEYVVAAYFIWVLVFSLYVPLLFWQHGNLRRDIEDCLKRSREKREARS